MSDMVMEWIEKWAGVSETLKTIKYSNDLFSNFGSQFKRMGEIAGMQTDKVNDFVKALDRLKMNNAWQSFAADLHKAGASADEIDRLRRSFEALNEHQQKAADLAEKFKKGQSTWTEGAATTAAGFTGLMAGMAAVKEAGKGETILASVQLTGGYSDAEMKQVQEMVKGQDDPLKAAQMARFLSSAGLSSKEMSTMLEYGDQFATAQEFGKGATNGAEVFEQAFKMSQMFEKRDNTDRIVFMDLYNKVNRLQPEDSAKMFDSVQQLAPVAQAMNMSDESILLTAAFNNQIGAYGFKGGSSTLDMLNGLAAELKKPPQDANGKETALAKSMRRLDLIDQDGKSKLYDSEGKFDMQQLMTALHDKTGGMGLQERTALFDSIFGKGSGMAEIFADDTVGSFYANMHNQMKQMPTVGQEKEAYDALPEGQIKAFEDNIKKLTNELLVGMAPLLGDIAEFLKDIVSSLIDFVREHPVISKIIAGFVGIMITLGLLAGPLKMIKGGWDMLTGGISSFLHKRRQPTMGDSAADQANNIANENRFEDLNKAKDCCCCCCEDSPGTNKKKGDSQSDPDGQQDESNNKKKRRKPSRLNRRPTLGDPGGSAGGNQGSRRYRMQRDTSNGRLRDRATPPSGGNPPAGGNPGPGNAGSQSIWSRIGTGFKNFFTSPVGKGLLTAGKFAVKALPVVGAVSTAVDIGMMAYDGIKKVAPQITEKAKEIGTKVKGFFQDKFEKAKEIGSKVKDFFTQRFANPTEFKDKVSTFFKTGINKEAENAPKGMPKIGSDIVTGLWNGMSSLGGWLSKMVGNFVTQNVEVPSRLALDIHSPSRKMMEQGKYVTEGLALGMTNNAGLIKGASKQLTGQVGVGKSALAASMQTRSGAAGGGEMHIHVHPHPHQRAEEIADEVMRKLGSSSRGQMMNTGTRVNLGAF